VLPPTAKGLNLYQDRRCLGEVVQKGDARPSSGATIAMVAMVAIRGPLALGLKRHQASFVWPAQRSAVRGYPFWGVHTSCKSGRSQGGNHTLSHVLNLAASCSWLPLSVTERRPVSIDLWADGWMGRVMVAWTHGQTMTNVGGWEWERGRMPWDGCSCTRGALGPGNDTLMSGMHSAATWMKKQREERNLIGTLARNHSRREWYELYKPKVQVGINYDPQTTAYRQHTFRSKVFCVQQPTWFR
jgi:hypothetical protein